ncbi:MAG TPA: DUF6159 family protein, partial [Xanthomonadaceae bacterium]|nr:DUF6159 family protein [Xanthomonadaceae bacterium]
VLRAIQERSGLIGQFVISLIGIAWTLATSMVVPVLVSKNVGPVEAIKESAQLLKRTWGENLIGNGGVGVFFGMITVSVMLVGMIVTVACATNAAMPLVVLFGSLTVLAVIGISLIHSAIAGIYSAALYRYATDGKAPAGFDGRALREAFRIKA